MTSEPKEPLADGMRHPRSSRRATALGLAAVRSGATRRLRLPGQAGSVTLALLVAAAIYLVHGERPAPGAHAAETAAGAAAAPSGPSGERAFHGALPQNVVEMREEILAAVQAGDVAALGEAVAWSESRNGRRPDLGAEAADDPVAHWKRLSADGAGREVLAQLANLLALPPARLAIGKDPENTLVYVWPYLAELPPDTLTPTEEVDLLRLMPPEAAGRLRAAGKWSWWRVAIGADGTWLAFRKYE